MRHNLRETMRRIAQSGVGIILTTHHVADIIPEIKRVVLMRDGRVLADGLKEELLTRASMSKLFDCSLEISCREGYYDLW